MEAHRFDVDLVLEPRLSARRAWIVASAAGGLSLILATALVLVLPLRETQVFTVLVDRQTGDAENILQVAPTGIESRRPIGRSAAATQMRMSPWRRNSCADSWV